MLDYEQTLLLLTKAKQGDEYAKEQLIKHNYPLVKSIVRRYKNKGVEYDEAGFENSQMLMSSQLAALVAQRLYGDSESYQLLNPRVNNSYVKALEIIENWTQEGESILNPKE